MLNKQVLLLFVCWNADTLDHKLSMFDLQIYYQLFKIICPLWFAKNISKFVQ